MNQQKQWQMGSQPPAVLQKTLPTRMQVGTGSSEASAEVEAKDHKGLIW